jgi:hypothetical protein
MKYSMNATKGHVPTTHLQPVIPTAMQNARKAPSADIEAPGESMKRIKEDFLPFCHSTATEIIQISKSIRLRGNARTVAGKSPVRNWRRKEDAK